MRQDRDGEGHEHVALRRALVVDDVQVERRLLTRVLERTGRYVVVGEAGDGAAAVGLIAGMRPDLVLLDASMPVMDGLEALPLLVEAVPGARVVMLSGLPTSDVAPTAMSLGAFGYVEKGMHPSELVATIDRFFDAMPSTVTPS